MVDLNWKKKKSFRLIVGFGDNFQVVKGYWYVLQGVDGVYMIFSGRDVVKNEFFLV
jgi:hypothetical protein